MEGHSQEIECLINDGTFVISSCLSGEIRVWNSSDGEMVTQIDRQKYFSSLKNNTEGLTLESDHHSDYESGSPPSVGEIDFGSYNVKPSNRRISNASCVYNLVSGLNEKGVHYRKHGTNDVTLKPNLNFTGLKLANQQSCGTSEWKSSGYDFETPYKLLTKEESSSSIEEIESGDKVSSVANGICDSLEYQVPTSAIEDNWNCVVRSRFVLDFCSSSEKGCTKSSVAPVWCIDCFDDVIAAGCSDGQIEFWESSTGKLLVCSF